LAIDSKLRACDLIQLRLLDENFPADFAALLVGHEASNVHSHGWAGIKNGELLRRAHGVCDVFVTLDRNLEFQQNIKVLPYGIVVVRSRSNRIIDLTPHIPAILLAASQVGPGRAVTVGA
jgi:hypothetical protein